MAMSAKDYEMLAALVRKHLDATWDTDPVRAMGIEAFGIELADELGKDNPRFNRIMFFKACNIEAGASA
jgi:hypothetical protein